jgi:hypothetical protein
MCNGVAVRPYRLRLAVRAVTNLAPVGAVINRPVTACRARARRRAAAYRVCVASGSKLATRRGMVRGSRIAAGASRRPDRWLRIRNNRPGRTIVLHRRGSVGRSMNRRSIGRWVGRVAGGRRCVRAFLVRGWSIGRRAGGAWGGGRLCSRGRGLSRRSALWTRLRRLLFWFLGQQAGGRGQHESR